VALALIDLGVTMGDDQPAPLAVKGRYWDYRRADDREGFPDFDRGQLLQKTDQIATFFVYGLGYLLLHEQYHYLNGHLAFLGQGSKLLPFLEVNEGDVTNPADPLTCRALEWDADTHAAVMHFVAAAGSVEDPPLTGQRLEEVRENVVASFVGASALMGLLSVADRARNVKLGDRCHPSAALRTLMLLRTYDEYLRGRNARDEDVAALVSDALLQLRRIYDHLGVRNELEQALQAFARELPEDHPLQHERIDTYRRLGELLPRLREAASETQRLLGIDQPD
jgi:hypothetical protein